MITSKQEFIAKFQNLAEREADEIRPKNREAFIERWFESEWEKYQQWYRDNYSQMIRDSLTLEQLYRLDH